MISKIRFLSFLRNKHKSYVLKYPVEKVSAAINNIPRAIGLWSDSNITLKYFDGSRFTIKLIRLNADVTSPKLASGLFGEIEKKNDCETILRIKVTCSAGTYISFFISILGGLFFLGKLIFFRGHIENLLWGSLMIALFPFLLIGYKNVSDLAVIENFEHNLFKELER